MKILFITDSLNAADGWGRYSSLLVKGFTKNGDQVSVVQFPVVDHLHRYLANPLLSWSSARKINKIIKDTQPDVIHILVEPYVHILPFLSVSPKTKIFLTIHGTYAFIPEVFEREKIKQVVSSLMFKKSIARLNGIIAVSSITKNYFTQEYKKRYGKLPSVKLSVVTNGIDPEQFPIVEFSKPTTSTKNILFVGVVKKRKGILEAIEALALYKERYGGNFVYTIVGTYEENSPYFQTLKKRVTELGLEDNVIFTGKISDEELKEYYKKADAYLMLSIKDGAAFEGFGLVYLEANAYGVPAIGASGSGAQDAIKNGETGYVVDPHSREAVCGALHKVLEEKTINPRSCQEWVRANDISLKIKALLQIYSTNHF